MYIYIFVIVYYIIYNDNNIEDMLTSLCHGSTATRDGSSNGGVPFQRRAKLFGPRLHVLRTKLHSDTMGATIVMVMHWYALSHIDTYWDIRDRIKTRSNVFHWTAPPRFLCEAPPRPRSDRVLWHLIPGSWATGHCESNKQRRAYPNKLICSQ